MLKSLMLLSMGLILSSFSHIKQTKSPDVNVLIGQWKLDMTPNDKTDANFAMMRIETVSKDHLEGDFYRNGVRIREGRINTQTGIIYAALMSGDNSGEYNSSFYYKDGKLYGTTHSVQRGFLAVWVATKLD